MSTIIERFDKIKLNISKVSNADSAKIVAVSKTFSLDHIMPLIDYGHTHYGENKVQEADIKWTNIRKERTNPKPRNANYGGPTFLFCACCDFCSVFVWPCAAHWHSSKNKTEKI